MIENEITEFKREYVDDVKKTVIAFANCGGGCLYVGIQDDGTICGVDNVDDCQLRIVSALRDAITPDISIFTNISVVTMENKQVIKIEVQHGTGYPYYLHSKGIRPDGVFVRKGACTVPATSAEILKMIKEAAGDSYETERSLRQQLTFETADRYFDNKQIAFGDEQKRTLGIILSDGTYSNLGLLLSDQCNHSIKIAAFDGTVKTVFKDRKEFTGSLLQQLENAYGTLLMYNHLSSELKGLYRVDRYDYPLEAVREALLNAVVHREYSFAASTLISVFDNRMEFVSVGGLAKGITKDDIMLGISISRNKNLADVFYRLHLIEAYGTGLLKIKECYRGSEVQPTIEISDNAFKITLPKLYISSGNADDNFELSAKDMRILEYLDKKHDRCITRIEAQILLECSQTTAITTLGELVRKGVLIREGNGGRTRYRLADKE